MNKLLFKLGAAFVNEKSHINLVKFIKLEMSVKS